MYAADNSELIEKKRYWNDTLLYNTRSYVAETKDEANATKCMCLKHLRVGAGIADATGTLHADEVLVRKFKISSY